MLNGAQHGFRKSHASLPARLNVFGNILNYPSENKASLWSTLTMQMLLIMEYHYKLRDIGITSQNSSGDSRCSY